jgi:signal transduction histidine kinase
MRTSTARRIAWSAWALILAAVIGLGVLALVAGPGEDFIFVLLAFVSVMGYATVGAMIAARHPGNAIGWLFMWFGMLFLLGLTAEAYTTRSVEEGLTLPATAASALISQAAFPLAFGALPLILLLFPTGRLLSRRWKPAAWGAVAAIMAATVGIVLRPGLIEGHGTHLSNPLGIDALAGVATVMRVAGGIGALAMAALSAAGLFLRYRRAGREERQQIRWLAYVAGLGLAFLLMLFASEQLAPHLGDFFWIGFFFTIALGIPAASGIAILRYRLYDLDIVVKRTVVFGILAVFITAAYLLVVIGIPTVVFGVGGGAESLVPFLAAAALALLFQPVRRAASRLANRLVYGRRGTPYELLAEFAGQAGGTYSIDDVLPRMARAAAEGTGAARASVWLHVGSELRRSAVWPSPSGEEPQAAVPISEEIGGLPGEDRTFPVRHQGELLGALAVVVSPREPLTPTGEKLLEDLATQAALILRNVRLTEELRANLEELRASRQRLVAAQDEERRRLERNIHDGAQQQLVALAVKLRLVETMAAQDPSRASVMAAQAKAELQEALDDLRDLARGIYPPLLQDKGLAAAVESQARKAPVPVTVDADGVGRFPQEVEAGVYFCVLEALQNVAKYAEASRVRLRLALQDGDLLFEVADEGRGFDPSTAPRGSGLQNMSDRLEALGGSLSIDSQPGRGTTVTGRVPAAR